MLRAVVLIAALALPAAAARAQHWSSHGQEWPQVDCAQSHIVVPGQQLCRKGPVAGPNQAYTIRPCAFEQWYAYVRSPSSHGGVQVFMRQPGTTAECWVNEFSDPDAALEAFGAVRDATVRSRLIESNGLLSANFTSKAQEQCGAFIRYGPRWQGGHTYSIRGILCANKSSPSSPDELRNFAGAIVVKTE